MPDLPPSPLDIAAPPLTIQQFARMAGRDERLIKDWVRRGAIKVVGHEPSWPYRTLLAYKSLIEYATHRPRRGVRKSRAVKRATTEQGQTVTITPRKRRRRQTQVI
jgi:hypothetical protein